MLESLISAVPFLEFSDTQILLFWPKLSQVKLLWFATKNRAHACISHPKILWGIQLDLLRVCNSNMNIYLWSQRGYLKRLGKHWVTLKTQNVTLTAWF